MRPRYHCSLETTLNSLVLAVRRETFTAHGLVPRLWTAVRTATRPVLLGLIWLPCPFYAFGSSPEEIAARAPVAEIKVKEGVAVKGYDVVAYVIDRIPVKGSPEYMYQWKGGPPGSSEVPNIVQLL